MPRASYVNPFGARRQAALYDSWFDTPLGEAMDRLEKALIYRLAQPREGELALDMGTGTGHFACDLASQGLRVIGYDPSEAMLQIARAKKAPVSWQRGDAEALPFRDDTFDLVLSTTTLEFVRDISAALEEMWRVAAPGGRMVVGVLNAQSSWAKSYLREASVQDTPFQYARFFTAAEFVSRLGCYGQVRWSSSGFFAPTGRGLRVAGVLEVLGQAFCRGRGALLVGRIDK